MSASHDTKAVASQANPIPFGNLEPGEVIGKAYPISENYLVVETQPEQNHKVIRFHVFDLANKRKNCCYQINIAKYRDYGIEKKEFLIAAQGLPNETFLIMGSKGNLAIIKDLTPKNEATIIDINDKKAENGVIKGSLPDLPTFEKREEPKLKQAFSPTKNEIAFIVTTTEKSLLSIDFVTGKQSHFVKLSGLMAGLNKLDDFGFDNEGKRAIAIGRKATKMVAEIHTFDQKSGAFSLEKTQLLSFDTRGIPEIVSVFHPYIIISLADNFYIIDLELQKSFFKNIDRNKLLGWLVDGKAILGARDKQTTTQLLDPDNYQLTPLDPLNIDSNLSEKNYVLLNNGFAVKLTQSPLSLEIKIVTDCYLGKKIERCIDHTLTKGIPISDVRNIIIPYAKGRNLFFAAEQKTFNNTFLPSYHLSEELQVAVRDTHASNPKGKPLIEELTALINKNPENIAGACETIRKKYPTEFKRTALAGLFGIATEEGGPLHDLFKKILAECRTAKTQALLDCAPRTLIKAP